MSLIRSERSFSSQGHWDPFRRDHNVHHVLETEHLIIRSDSPSSLLFQRSIRTVANAHSPLSTVSRRSNDDDPERYYDGRSTFEATPNTPTRPSGSPNGSSANDRSPSLHDSHHTLQRVPSNSSPMSRSQCPPPHPNTPSHNHSRPVIPSHHSTSRSNMGAGLSSHPPLPPPLKSSYSSHSLAHTNASFTHVSPRPGSRSGMMSSDVRSRSRGPITLSRPPSEAEMDARSDSMILGGDFSDLEDRFPVASVAPPSQPNVPYIDLESHGGSVFSDAASLFSDHLAADSPVMGTRLGAVNRSVTSSMGWATDSRADYRTPRRAAPGLGPMPLSIHASASVPSAMQLHDLPADAISECSQDRPHSHSHAHTQHTHAQMQLGRSRGMPSTYVGNASPLPRFTSLTSYPSGHSAQHDSQQHLGFAPAPAPVLQPALGRDMALPSRSLTSPDSALALEDPYVHESYHRRRSLPPVSPQARDAAAPTDTNSSPAPPATVPVRVPRHAPVMVGVDLPVPAASPRLPVPDTLEDRICRSQADHAKHSPSWAHTRALGSHQAASTYSRDSSSSYSHSNVCSNANMLRPASGRPLMPRQLSQGRLMEHPSLELASHSQGDADIPRQPSPFGVLESTDTDPELPTHIRVINPPTPLPARTPSLALSTSASIASEASGGTGPGVEGRVRQARQEHMEREREKERLRQRERELERQARGMAMLTSSGPVEDTQASAGPASVVTFAATPVTEPNTPLATTTPDSRPPRGPAIATAPAGHHPHAASPMHLRQRYNAFASRNTCSDAGTGPSASPLLRRHATPVTGTALVPTPVSRAPSSLSFHVPRSSASPGSVERSHTSAPSHHSHSHSTTHGHHHSLSSADAHGYSAELFLSVEASLDYPYPLPDTDAPISETLLPTLPSLFDTHMGPSHSPMLERFCALNLPAEAFKDSKTAAMDLRALSAREWQRVQVRALYRSHHPALIHHAAAPHDRDLPAPCFTAPGHYELLKKGKKHVICPVVTGHNLDAVHLMMLNLLMLPRPLKEVAAAAYRRRVTPDMWLLMYATMDAAREAASHFDGMLTARGHEVLCKLLAKRVQQFKMCLCLSSFERNRERAAPLAIAPGTETSCIRDILVRENATTRSGADAGGTSAQAFSQPVDDRDVNSILDQVSRDFLRDHPPNPEQLRAREDARANKKKNATKAHK